MVPTAGLRNPKQTLHRRFASLDWVFAAADVGRKNVVFGIALFLLFGVELGIP